MIFQVKQRKKWENLEEGTTEYLVMLERQHTGMEGV